MTYAQLIILFPKHHVYVASRDDDARREPFQKYFKWERVKFTSFLDSQLGGKFAVSRRIRFTANYLLSSTERNVCAFVDH